MSTKQGVEALRRPLNVLLFSCFLVTAAAIGLAFQVHSRNETIEDIQFTVKDLQSYVNELREPPSEEEIAQNRAISEAVQTVPEIRDILCEEFPDAAACQNNLRYSSLLARRVSASMTAWNELLF